MCLGVDDSLRIDSKDTHVRECPLKETCFRFKATPSEFRQAYFIRIPYDPVTGKCKHLLPLDKKEAVEALDGPVAADIDRFRKGTS